MKKAIIGKKLGMTQLFDNNGNVVPVTVIEAGHFETENPSMTALKNKLENYFSQVKFVILKQSSPVKFIGK